jgi:hypothetical protein
MTDVAHAPFHPSRSKKIPNFLLRINKIIKK